MSSFWYDYYCSLCPSYSSLRNFDTTKLIPNKPHPYIIHSGSSEYLNSKNSTILKLLCGRYRLNSLRHKFNPNISPICQMCLMNVVEDTDHFLFICPYLDGARFYALLLWKYHRSNIIYNLFHSALQFWHINKLTPLFLDPMSQFSYTDIAPHKDLQTNMYKFVQDYAYSIHRQRQIYYGDISNTDFCTWKRR